MASCSTFNSQSGNTLPELPTKLRPFESLGCEDCFSAGNLDTEYNDCVFTDLKYFVAKDKELHEWLKISEAENKMKTELRKFLIEAAEKIKKDDEDEEEDEETDEDSDDSDSVDEEHEVNGVMIPFAAMLENRALLEDKAALTKLEVRSFIFKIWLRRIQLTREKNQDICLLDFEYAIHNAQEAVKQFKDFIYNQRYNREELQAMLPYYEQSVQEASTKTLEENEKASFEMLQEDVAIFFSNKARICALLGLQLDFLFCLDEMSPEDRDHLTIFDWIVTFLANDYESVLPTDNKALLAAIGFDPLSSAVETIMARAGNTQQHIETCEMAERFIRDEFKYNPLLSPQVGRFPFQSSLTNTWFQLPSDEKGKTLCHINVMNVVTNESAVCTLIQTKLSDLVPEDEQTVVLFHGTDHKSARDILLRGIDLREGRQNRDFSCGSGFYLTPRNKLDDALNWGKSITTKPALLIFQLNRREHLDARKLNLHGNQQRWREIVSSFRSGKRTAKTRNSLIEYDLIEGPAATISRNESGELVIEQKPSSDQMCLISDDYALNFRQALHSVMFLDVL